MPDLPPPRRPRVADPGDGGWGRAFRRRHRRLGLLGGVVVVLLLASSVAVAVGLLTERRQGVTVAVEPCSGSRTVRVLADPSLVPTLRRVADEASGTVLSTGVCAEVEVLARPSAEAAAAFADDPGSVVPGGLPDLWVPDSSVWLGRAVADPPREDVTLTDLGSLVHTPLVVATSPEVVAASGWTGAGPTWSQVLASGRAVALPDVATSAAGVQALVALTTTVPDAGARREALSVAAAAVRQGEVPDLPTAFAQVADGGEQAPLLPTTEQQVFEASRGSVTTPAVAVRPTDGEAGLDYPVVRVDTAEREAGVDAAAVEGVVRLLETEGREAAVADGFREPLTGVPGPSPEDPPADPPGPAAAAASVAPADPPTAPADPPAETPADPPADAPADAPAATALPVPGWADVELLLEQLAELGRPARVLAVLDASASMRGVTATGATRAQVTQTATASAVAQLPATSSVGLWFFATGLGTDGAGAPTDHVEVVPLRPLDPAAAGVDQRAELAAGASQLTARLAPGGTGLYDTTLAAVRSLRETDDPESVSTVVLVTDGRQDDPGAASLAELVATLQAEADPERPVRVVAVGISADVDPAELTAIAEATGGAAYLAEQPEDLQTVLADALRRR